MNKALRILLVAGGTLLFLLITVWFYVSPPMFLLQMTLPEHARDLPWSFEEGSRIYNQRIQSQYTDGMDALVLTKQLQHEGYEVLVSAEQAQEANDPSCGITWWSVGVSKDGLQRITSDMDSHTSVCSKTKQMQANYIEGTRVSDLAKELQEQDFQVLMSAHLRRNKVPCGLRWSITWTEDDNVRASDITGTFRYNCI